MTDSSQIMEEQGTAWLEAAEAVRSGDHARSIDLIVGPDTDDLGLMFARIVTQCVVGSAICGAELAKLTGHEIGSDDGFWGLDLGGSDDGAAVTAMRCVAAAANGEVETVGGLVEALQNYDDPHGSFRRLANLSARLIDVFLAITASKGGAE